MPWTSLRFTVAGADADAWADALLDAGALAVDVLDAAAGTADEVPQFGEPGEFEPGVWASNLLSALFDEAADPSAIVAAIAADRCWRAPVVYTLSRVEEQDWVRLTKDQFEPIQKLIDLHVADTVDKMEPEDILQLVAYRVTDRIVAEYYGN